MTIEFMGQQFQSVYEVGKEFPAFTGDDARRAIRNGCKTVMEVEKFCFRFRNRAFEKMRAAAQRSQYGSKPRLGAKKKGKAK